MLSRMKRLLPVFALIASAGMSQVLFFDGFNNNNAGWTLDTQWGIGAATASPPAYNGPDPSFDADGVAGGGVAGVLIGGNTVAGQVHPTYWLTSPIIDTAGAKYLRLEFDRWLNSDYMGYMQNYVQYFDGTNWQNLFITGGAPGVNDTSWNHQFYPIPTTGAGPCFRVRFGYATFSTGAFSVSSWNVDNVQITAGTYLYERFNNNSAGWTLDTTWGIGPATASAGHAYGNADPGSDADGIVGGGVGGVVIGGNAPTVVHGYYYLTSPAMDTSGATALTLQFRRWLNSDYTPYMANRVEVFDGATWQVIWQTAGSPGVQDNSWTTQSFNIAAYKNAAMQVRFGYNIGSSGVFAVSSWNVDNVVIFDSTPALALEFCSNSPGALTMSVRGPAGATTVNVVTLAAGAYPFGWFYGVDIGINDLVSQVSSGFPFVTTLDGSGSFSLSLPGGALPSGLTLYGVSVLLGPGSIPAGASAPTNHLIP